MEKLETKRKAREPKLTQKPSIYNLKPLRSRIFVKLDMDKLEVVKSSLSQNLLNNIASNITDRESTQKTTNFTYRESLALSRRIYSKRGLSRTGSQVLQRVQCNQFQTEAPKSVAIITEPTPIMHQRPMSVLDSCFKSVSLASTMVRCKTSCENYPKQSVSFATRDVKKSSPTRNIYPPLS